MIIIERFQRGCSPRSPAGDISNRDQDRHVMIKVAPPQQLQACTSASLDRQ